MDWEKFSKNPNQYKGTPRHALGQNNCETKFYCLVSVFSMQRDLRNYKYNNRQPAINTV